ncbi:hypothetical protein [Clostridium saccharoperbutylacetonicum]|uniref:hypothetical protein n=1 Tax=Clostridium saccharoperbutylacetonicum TaxID=36745 RepID=UPI000983E3E5|nr:hypothetical protein [Clostridium saccharoperbutylacetonicum]AQR96495.1 hypothetical protein CLSAP_38190 [Clostridium saccharoperbutylacetonicum]NSB32369.1 hypothetical protein [Clostridium saccharoperbutylacetonicum]
MWYFYDDFQNVEFDKIVNEINNAFRNIFIGKEWKEIFTKQFEQEIRKTKLHKLFYDYYELYKTTDGNERRKIYSAYCKNMRIEEICLGTIKPISYSQLNENVSKKLRELFDYLYSDFTKRKLFKNNVGGLKGYYEQFYIETSININKRCPFCGIQAMASGKNSHRPDFDHYLLESKYPFVSLLRKNLMPMCDDCNKKYKKVKDISNYKKVFYPFSRNINNKLVYKNNTYKIVNNTYSEEVTSWDEIFDVENRIDLYSENLKLGWITSINETKIFGAQLSFDEALKMEIARIENNYYSSDNFIEKAYLEDLQIYV